MRNPKSLSLQAQLIRSDLQARYLSYFIPNAVIPYDAMFSHVQPFLSVEITKDIISKLLEDDNAICNLGNLASEFGRSIIAEFLFSVIQNPNFYFCIDIPIPDKGLFRGIPSKNLCIALNPEATSIKDILEGKFFRTTIEDNMHGALLSDLARDHLKLRDLLSLVLFAVFFTIAYFSHGIGDKCVATLMGIILMGFQFMISSANLQKKDSIPGMQFFTMPRDVTLRRNLLDFHEKSSVPKVVIEKESSLTTTLLASGVGYGTM